MIKNFILLVGFGIFFHPFLVCGQIISDRSEVNFRVKHLGGMVQGSMKGMEGSVYFDAQNLGQSHMEASVRAQTVDTGNRARDADLRKENFFYTDQYPNITFRSKLISKSEQGYEVTGDLTIKEHTHEIKIPFKREVRGPETLYSGSFTLNRKDYGLGKSAFPPIGKTVEVRIQAVVKE